MHAGNAALCQRLASRMLLAAYLRAAASDPRPLTFPGPHLALGTHHLNLHNHTYSRRQQPCRSIPCTFSLSRCTTPTWAPSHGSCWPTWCALHAHHAHAHATVAVPGAPVRADGGRVCARSGVSSNQRHLDGMDPCGMSHHALPCTNSHTGGCHARDGPMDPSIQPLAGIQLARATDIHPPPPGPPSIHRPASAAPVHCPCMLCRLCRGQRRRSRGRPNRPCPDIAPHATVLLRGVAGTLLGPRACHPRTVRYQSCKVLYSCRTGCAGCYVQQRRRPCALRCWWQCRQRWQRSTPWHTPTSSLTTGG